MKKQGISIDELSVKHSEYVKELEAQVTASELNLKDYRKEHGKLESFFNKVLASIEPVLPIDRIYEPSKSTSSPCVAVMQISDSHCGAQQMSDEIEGFNEFNFDICKTRQINYTNRFLNWVEMHRQAYKVNECAVLVTGDLISGDIHEELRVTNEFPVPVQCVKSAEILTEQIARLSPLFTVVKVHFIVEDNHARLTKKPQAKEAGFNSFNYVVGKIASIYLAKHPNVEFNIYPQHEKVVSVSNRQYLIMHGHGLPQYFGVPWYSVERRVGRESTARMNEIMTHSDIERRSREIGFHKLVFGHFHVPFDHALYSCCGSVSGTDAYDHKFGRHAYPSQSAWMVHPKYGEYDRINFDLSR
jgi:hypothetical protein